MNKQPELEINQYGDKGWYLNGSLHREDGPAAENADGYKGWFINGKLHRVDGPAVEYSGSIYKSWYLNGNRYDSKEEWFQALTPEQQENYLWSLDE
jgi:hypothetical protein